MSMHFCDLAVQAALDGAIAPEEILALRRDGWSDGAVDAAEAEAIFTLNDHIAQATPEWTDFFVEALGEFVVNGSAPKGYVDHANADWLVARIDRDGRLESMAELQLLVRVLEKATSVPDSFKAYALSQIEQAVLTGEGPTRDGGSLDKGAITTTEATLLRRMIFAQGGDRPAGVSEAEAEMLFRLKNAALGADNAPEWKRLFVQGVGNFLEGYTSYEPLSAERTAELENFMADTRHGIGRFLGRLARADVNAGFQSTFDSSEGIDRNAAVAVAAAEEITSSEKAWLQTQLDADGRIDEYEQALLDFLFEN
jgi:hypothetical protein